MRVCASGMLIFGNKGIFRGKLNWFFMIYLLVSRCLLSGY